jgi:hypothetical protein
MALEMIKRFENPDDTRSFANGCFDIVRFDGVVIGRATYQPGWRWSADIAPLAGTASCMVAHVGVVLSGRAAVAMNDGRVFELRAGDAFSVAPGHDSWVIGDEPYVSLHILGADSYADSDSTRQDLFNQSSSLRFP